MEELNRKKPKLNKGLPALALLFSGLFILLALFLTKVMMVDAIKLRNQAESQLVNRSSCRPDGAILWTAPEIFWQPQPPIGWMPT